MTNPFRALFNRRDGIGSSHDLWNLLARGSVSASGSVVNERTAFNVAVIGTCVSLISRTIATLPVGIFERTPDGRGKKPAAGHPLERVLQKPNGWQTRAELVQMLQAHLLLRGNAYAWENWVEIPGAGLQLTELIPLHPDRVQVEQREDWSLVYTLVQKNGQRVTLPSDEVLHLRGLSTDGFMGRSILDDLRDPIGVALSTQEYSSRFWKDDATPPIVLRHPMALSPAAKSNIETSWSDTYGSKDKRRIAVIEEGMDIKQLAFTPNDSQMLQTRQFTRGELAAAFHVPPHMIGDTEKSTSWGTGIEQQQIGFLTFAINPWLECWEQRLNQNLITAPNRFFVEFNVNGLLRGDATARSNFYWRMIQMGAMSPNEVRSFENMNPIAQGDVYLQPTNLAPLGFDPAAAGSGSAQ